MEHRNPKQNHKSSTKTTQNPSHKLILFEPTVKNFCGKLKACSADQRLVATEVLKSISTFMEEILLAFHITIGSEDTINVKDLLFQDLVDLISHLEPEEKNHVTSYLRCLQIAERDCLSSLYWTITVTMGSSDLQVAEEELLRKNIKEQERNHLIDFLTMTTSIIQGILKKNPEDSYVKSLVERMKKHRGTFSNLAEFTYVEEINKRNLGKMIVHYIGHEGIEDKSGLRRLLQACIDFLKTNPERSWRDASIAIYDEDDRMYKIASGSKTRQFICRMKDGEPFIKEKTSVAENQPRTQHYMPFHETPDDPPQARNDHICLIL